MQLKVVWQLGSSNPENATNLATISQWWSNLNGKEITWRQRMLPQSGSIEDLDWEPQRFDELFVINQPELRGTTLYWSKPDAPQERNTTVEKLELDTLRQQLYAYPQSQKGLVLRIAIPQIVYQKLDFTNPQIQVVSSGSACLVSFRDDVQKIEVRIALGADQANLLKQQLP